MFQWKESERAPKKLKSHSADDDAHGVRRCEKSSLANEISDRLKGYANRRGSEFSQLPFAAEIDLRSIGPMQRKKASSLRKRTRRVRHRVLSTSSSSHKNSRDSKSKDNSKSGSGCFLC